MGFERVRRATRHGRKGPGSAEDLAKILSGLYKGEKEEFLHVNPQAGFTMYDPPSWVSEQLRLPVCFILPRLDM